MVFVEAITAGMTTYELMQQEHVAWELSLF
jgi:hypothetical protein